MRKRALSLVILTGFTMGLSGCLGKTGAVSITGGEHELRITAPNGYDTLAVAKGHCNSFKKSAVFNGRGEGRGGVVVTNFKCMLR